MTLAKIQTNSETLLIIEYAKHVMGPAQLAPPQPLIVQAAVPHAFLKVHLASWPALPQLGEITELIPVETAAQIIMNSVMSQIIEFARSAVYAQLAPELQLHALVVVLPYISTIMTVF